MPAIQRSTATVYLGITYPGYHWSSEPHLVRAHKRYTRLLLRALRKES